MRHRLRHKLGGVSSSHKRAMLANMTCALISNEQIHTTLARAKALRPYVERLITKAKNNTLANTRYLIAILKNPEVVKKLLQELGPRYLNRPGGYLRILKAGYRYGDAAAVAYIALVDKPLVTTKENNKDTVINSELIAS